jgi:osmotically-inducible protein OsmY
MEAGGMAETLYTDAAARARLVLSRSQIYVLRKIEVDCECDAIALRGTVDSFYHKQLAQELVRTAVDGVDVINDLEVDYSRSLTDSSYW